MLTRYLTPHENRMREITRHMSPKPDPIHIAAAERQAEMDLEVRARLRGLKERFPLILFCRNNGGSGLRMATTLRHYFREYVNRMAYGGVDKIPASFNVVEAFLRSSDEHLFFDIRQEREHLLRAYGFMNWYKSTAGTLLESPSLLKHALDEGTIYSYDLIGAPDDFEISTPDSGIVPLGVSLVRHSDELSLMLLAGENPPYPATAEIQNISITTVAGRENIIPDENLTVASRDVPGLPGYSQVILLTRIYLDARRYDVRYVNLDMGQSYWVLTDDRVAVTGSSHPEETLANVRERLGRYDDLFSGATSLMYLPLYVIERQTDVIETRFATELNARKNTTKVKRALRVLEGDYVTLYRDVKCLASDQRSTPDTQEVNPPNLKSVSEGYWKELGAFEIGEDQDGNPIVGKTWVERRDSWFTHDPSSFLIRRGGTPVSGPDPGTIYVMRSPANDRDLYKIGLTRRPVADRAREIGQATGVPLPFGVLANWDVGDCSGVEAQVHAKLAAYRVSKRREFFRAPLPLIIEAVSNVVRTQSG